MNFTFCSLSYSIISCSTTSVGLKTSGFDRRMSIAKTSLNIGRRWAGNSVSGMFLNKEARTARNQAFMEAQASYLASELGKLKGSVVKIGQMLAIMTFCCVAK